MPDFDAQTIMKLVAKGDEMAFKSLYEEFGGFVYKIVYLSLKNSGKAEELTQDIFLKIWRFASKYDPSRSFKPWLSRIVSNEIISYHRTQKEEATSIDELNEDVGFQIGQNLDDVRSDEFSHDITEQLLKALDILTDNQRQVVVLKFYQGLKIREIAQTLSIRESAVKARLYSALEVMKKMVETD